MSKIKPKLAKLAWGVGLTLGVVLAWYFVAFSDYGLVAAGAKLLGVDETIYRLQGDFALAAARGDLPKAQETLKKIDEWEAEFNLKKEQDYKKKCEEWSSKYGVVYPRPMPQSFSSPFYHEIVCEMSRDWDGAFSYLEECSKIASESYERRDSFCASSVNAIKARLHYKMGKKSSAFVEYCELTPSMNIEQGAETIKSRYSLCQSKKYPYVNYIKSCFPSYSAFLQFMEDEYAKLGSPEEYAAAMDAYRSLEE